MPKWKCPKCKREFDHKNQAHSCVIYPVKKHLANGTVPSRNLYAEFVKKLKKIGPVKIESLPCCIHFVSDYTFGCCYILKNKIKIRFVLTKKIKDPRISLSAKISQQKYKYEITIKNKKELDAKLMKWLKEAYYLKVI